MAQTPLAAAQEWARKHPEMEARIEVVRWGPARSAGYDAGVTYTKLVTEYYAQAGRAETWRDSGVCRGCGHIIFAQQIYGSGWCESCFEQLREWVYLAGDAPRTVRIDLTRAGCPVSESLRPAAQAA